MLPVRYRIGNVNKKQRRMKQTDVTWLSRPLIPWICRNRGPYGSRKTLLQLHAPLAQWVIEALLQGLHRSRPLKERKLRLELLPYLSLDG